jgi:nucleoside 2-deoxyribosyltransferase
MTEKRPIAYLAVPYTKYGKGIEQSFIDASVLAARLIKTGLSIYSPVSHTHPIATYGNIDPKDQQFWYEFDRAMMQKCDALIVAHMDGWEQSSGMAYEIAFFAGERRPIFDLDPVTLNMMRRTSL